MLDFFFAFILDGDDRMHLLYVDESGSPSDPNQNFFILSGIAVFERQTHWIETQMNEIASRFCPEDPYAIELHGSPMRSGKSEWRPFPMEDRIQAIKDCLAIVSKSKGKYRLFASVVERGAYGADDPIKSCFEQIAFRFDKYLQRYNTQGRPERGIAIFDTSHTEKSIQHLARSFKHDGHSFGKLRNFAEVPLFLDSKASRMIQLADLVAFAIYRHYQADDSQYFDIIKNCFDSVGGTVHGLHVRKASQLAENAYLSATTSIVTAEIVIEG
ncbi:DUF3800 domain-containing protein [Pseudomonas pergaminensis]